MQSSGGLTRRVSERRASRALFVLALTCWIVAALLFSALSAHSVSKADTVLITYGMAAVFAMVTVTAAAIRAVGAGRILWAALSGGLLFRLAGDASSGCFRLFEAGPWVLIVRDAAYSVSYLLFLAALLWLVAETTRRVTLVAALDASSIMLSVGILAWYLVLEPVADSAGGLESWREVLMTLSGPMCNAGLLSLNLVVLFTRRRPPFANFLAGAFVSWLIADGLYLRIRSSGPYDGGDWPELLWALGLALFGLGALRAISYGLSGLASRCLGGAGDLPGCSSSVAGLGHRWLLPLAVVWVIAGVIGGALAVIASLYIDAMVLPRGDPGSFLDEVLTVATEQAVAGAIYGAATGVVLAIIAHRTASS